MHPFVPERSVVVSLFIRAIGTQVISISSTTWLLQAKVHTCLKTQNTKRGFQRNAKSAKNKSHSFINNDSEVQL
jgi:hypothetical protein